MFRTPRIIGTATVRTLEDVLSSWGTLRTISYLFEDAGIARGTVPPNLLVSGQRRTLANEYFASVKWSDRTDCGRVIDVINRVLGELTDDSDGKQRLLKALDQDGLRVENGQVIYSSGFSSLDHLTNATARLQLGHLPAYVERLNAQLDSDPAGAIGGAKDLLESVLKTILDERAIAYEKSAEIPDLWSAVRKELSLVPDNISQAAKGADALRRALGSLGVIVASVAELRNLYGTGHGRGKQHRGLGARHGRLVVGATATLATFLVETHREREKP